MRKFILPAIAVAVLAGYASSAYANEASGLIKRVDPHTKTVELMDGQSFFVPRGLQNPRIRLDQWAVIDYSVENGMNVASNVTVEKDGGISSTSAEEDHPVSD